MAKNKLVNKVTNTTNTITTGLANIAPRVILSPTSIGSGHAFNAESRAKTRCYIINNDTNEKLTFQFNPESMPYGRNANYTTIESPGMSYPLTQYVGGAVREFSFEVFYFDKPYSGKITKARKFLKALLPPEKNKKKFTKPPTFTMAYGYFVKTYVLTSLQVNDEWMNRDGYPEITRFTLTVRQVGNS